MQNISTRAMFAEPTLLVSKRASEGEITGQFTLDPAFVLFF